MIRSFAHKGLELFYRKGSTKGVQAQHAKRLRLILGLLDAARAPEDADAPGLALHPLKGDRKGFWAVTVQANWRVTFRIADGDAETIDYLDYH